MRLTQFVKIFPIAAIAICVLACNDSKNEVKITDIKQEEKTVVPPPPPPEKVTPVEKVIPNAVRKCFINEGLKYTTTITISYNDNEVIGIVSSEELGSGKKEGTGFFGPKKGDQLTIQFSGGNPPVIGDASEWTDKPWTITDKKISIPFKAKNHDTNKWEEMNYEFDLADCK